MICGPAAVKTCHHAEDAVRKRAAGKAEEEEGGKEKQGAAGGGEGEAQCALQPCLPCGDQPVPCCSLQVCGGRGRRRRQSGRGRHLVLLSHVLCHACSVSVMVVCLSHSLMLCLLHMCLYTCCAPLLLTPFKRWAELWVCSFV